MQQTIRTAKAKLADAEAKKAVRRAKHYAKAYGKLVWLVTRRAQRHHLFSVIPRDALRMMYAPRQPPFPSPAHGCAGPCGITDDVSRPLRAAELPRPLKPNKNVSSSSTPVGWRQVPPHIGVETNQLIRSMRFPPPRTHK